MSSARNSGKVGLYFGSFNPIHLGHLIIANHMVTRTDLDEVWMVVTPTSPFKIDDELIGEQHRLQMVRLAVADNPAIYATDVEFHLERPNYTCTTLRHLRTQYPSIDFSVILGEDNYDSLHKWQDYEEIIANHKVLVYPRKLTTDLHIEPQVSSENVVKFSNSPMIAISSSYIREAILAKHDVQFLLPDPVISYIGNNHLYEVS
jgi:nicotinate-nucleotide adenylyltransferase